jgi:hypothetical protein
MNSGSREGDDEDRWLRARERGEPGPPIPGVTAATYAELRSLLEDLPVVPAGATLRPGWQQSVLDAIDRGDVESAPAAASSPVRPIDSAPRSINKRRIAIVVSCLAVAAGIVIIVNVKVWPSRSAMEPKLAISTLAVGEPAHLGQDDLIAGATAVVRGVIHGPGELRVYGPDDGELARCTSTGPNCTVERIGDQTELRAEIILTVPGPLHVVLLSAPLPGPSGGRAHDLAVADRAEINYKSIDKLVR